MEQLRLKLEDSISEKFELLHLEIIRQFQIQQEELKLMIQNTTD